MGRSGLKMSGSGLRRVEIDGSWLQMIGSWRESVGVDVSWCEWMGVDVIGWE